MLVTVLLDGGAAMVLTALLAILAAAVNGGGYGGGLELAAYTMLGGLGRVVVVRRGGRPRARGLHDARRSGRDRDGASRRAAVGVRPRRGGGVHRPDGGHRHVR